VRPFRLLLAVAFLLALVKGATAVGDARADERKSALELQVKAAFLYKFAGYVEWPADVFPAADTPVTIGVLHDEAMAEALSKLVAGRTSSGRRVAVAPLKAGELIPAVHLLFIGASEEARLKAEVQAVAGRPILIVTEQEGAFDHGSMINFVLARGRVRFEVALKAVEASGLTLSSRLLSVAQTVRNGTP
jgi:YfiR/HmsC-like